MKLKRDSTIGNRPTIGPISDRSNRGRLTQKNAEELILQSTGALGISKCPGCISVLHLFLQVHAARHLVVEQLQVYRHLEHEHEPLRSQEGALLELVGRLQVPFAGQQMAKRFHGFVLERALLLACGEGAAPELGIQQSPVVDISERPDSDLGRQPSLLRPAFVLQEVVGARVELTDETSAVHPHRHYDLLPEHAPRVACM